MHSAAPSIVAGFGVSTAPDQEARQETIAHLPHPLLAQLPPCASTNTDPVNTARRRQKTSFHRESARRCESSEQPEIFRAVHRPGFVIKTTAFTLPIRPIG